MLCTHVCVHACVYAVHACVLLPGAQGSFYIRTTCDGERGGTTSLKSAEQPFLLTWRHPFFSVYCRQPPWQRQLKEGCVSGLKIQRTGYHDGAFKAVGAWGSCHVHPTVRGSKYACIQRSAWFRHLIWPRISKEKPQPQSRQGITHQ